VDHLERLLTGESGNRKIVVTDTVFSMDGDIAPLPDIVAICRKHNVLLYIDDAHGTGVLGQGLGAMHHFSINPEPWVVQMGTFSKALGSFGAYIAASNEITRWLVNSGRGFIFSTALPAPIVAASLAALKLVVSDRNLNNTLWTNRKILVDGLQSLGFDIAPSETPIIPVQIGTIDETICASQFLFTEGIYAPAIRPPTVATPRLRITVSAAHNRQDIEHLCDAFAKLKKRRVSNTC
jgi:7-keto-8-aminopelargonate synthetase-like enzyme